MRGALKFIDDDLPRAFSRVDDLHLLGDLADASDRSVAGDRRATSSTSRPSSRRSARRRSGSGREQVRAEAAARRRDHAAASIGCSRSPRASCTTTQEEFRSRRRPDERRRSARGVGTAKEQHPAPGELVGRRAGAARRARRRSSSARRSSSLPAGEPVIVAPTPEFYRWSFASMWTPGPFETQADARLLLPDRRRSRRGRPSGRTSTCATSTSRRSGRSRFTRCIPGHFLHYQHLRQVESKVRKSILFAPASFVEGWAHYCEQMMIEAGFGRQRSRRSSSDSSPKRSSASPASSSASGCTPRTCRSSRACGSSATRRSWRKRARGAKPSAARSIPTYLVYSRRQADAAEAAAGLQGAAGQASSRCAAFHDTLLAQRHARRSGLHRQLMLGDDADDRARVDGQRCRSTNTNATPAGTASR